MAEKTPKPKLYHLMSTSRSVRTRVVRAHNPMHSGLKQFIAGEYRLIRKRPLVFTEEQLAKHLQEVKNKQALGMLEVRTPDGRLVDLETMQVATASAAPPKPAPPKDSIANDEPWGEKMSEVPAGVPMQDAALDDSGEEYEDVEEEEVEEGAKAPAKKATKRRRRRSS